MKIILLKDIKKQGKKGYIIDVKDGYGSFLIKEKKAVVATSYGIDRLSREVKEFNEHEQELININTKIKEKLENEKIIFKVKTGLSDKVFGKISAKQISDYLNNLGYNIDKKQIKVLTPIDSLGHHMVDIQLHKKVIAKINIELVK